MRVTTENSWAALFEMGSGSAHGSTPTNAYIPRIRKKNYVCPTSSNQQLKACAHWKILHHGQPSRWPIYTKGKGFPYSLPSVGPGADPGVQAVNSKVTTISHPPGSRLSLLFARPAATFPAAEHHRPLEVAKLYYLVTEVHRCEQLAQVCYSRPN